MGLCPVPTAGTTPPTPPPMGHVYEVCLHCSLLVLSESTCNCSGKRKHTRERDFFLLLPLPYHPTMISAGLKGFSERRHQFYLPGQGRGRVLKDRQQRVGKGMPTRGNSMGKCQKERRDVCLRIRTLIWTQHGMSESLRRRDKAGEVGHSEGP